MRIAVLLGLLLCGIPLTFNDEPSALIVGVTTTAVMLLFGVRRYYLARAHPFSITIVIIVLLLIPLSLLVSVLPAETTIRSARLLWALSVGLEVAVVSGMYSHKLFSPLFIGYLLVGCLVAAAGLIGVDHSNKLPFIGILGSNIPFVATPELGTPAGFHPNEIAGVLTLFLPLAVVLAVGIVVRRIRASRWWSLFIIVATVLMAATALLTQSRSGVLAIFLSISVIMLWLEVRTRILWGVGIVITTVGIWGIGVNNVWETLRYSGISVDSSLFTVRNLIWQQAWHGLQDFSLTGMGLGTFRIVGPLLYPQREWRTVTDLAHAHNLFLQSGLDFGWIGILLLLTLFLYGFYCLFSVARDEVRDKVWHHRYWVGGLTASLLAHFFYSLTDAVALGARPQVAFWALLGFVFSPSLYDAAPIKWSRHLVTPMFLGVSLLAIWILWAWPVNSVALMTAEIVVAESTVEIVSPQRCRANWYVGLSAHQRHLSRQRDQAWATLLSCTADFLSFMPHIVPDNQYMAEVAIEMQPMLATGYFWLGDILVSRDQAQAIALYRQGLQQEPTNGTMWIRLGHQLVLNDPQAAAEAYLQGCYHGDPGSNGCWNAGKTMERLGNVAEAIEYYQLSRWSVARERGNQLQAEWQQSDSD